MPLTHLTLDEATVRGPVDASLIAGAEMTLSRVLRLEKGDRLVFIVERSLNRLVPAFASVAEELGLRVLWLGGEGSDFDDGAVKRFLKEEFRTTAGSMLLSPVTGLSMHFRRWIMRIFGERRHAHLVGVDEVALRSALRADPDDIVELGTQLRAAIGAAREMEIETQSGALLRLVFDPTHRWHLDSGVIGPGESTGLPAGQLFTTPGGAEGRLVVDGGVVEPLAGRSFGEREPIDAHIRAGRLSSLSGVDDVAEFGEELRGDGDAARVAQVCFGVNPAVIARSSSDAVNDVRSGVHLVLGFSASTWTGARWDGMRMTKLGLSRATVKVSGRPILVDGSYTF